MASATSTGKHSDPVWKLRWVDRGVEQQEVLVSISTDGRVTQWSTAKVPCSTATASSVLSYVVLHCHRRVPLMLAAEHRLVVIGKAGYADMQCLKAGVSTASCMQHHHPHAYLGPKQQSDAR